MKSKEQKNQQLKEYNEENEIIVETYQFSRSKKVYLKRRVVTLSNRKSF